MQMRPRPVIGPLRGTIFGHIAFNEIERSQGRLTSRDMAIAGIVVGYVLAALDPVLYGFVLFVLFFLSSQTGGYMPPARASSIGCRVELVRRL